MKTFIKRLNTIDITNMITEKESNKKAHII